jgi:hypothetical protein
VRVKPTKPERMIVSRVQAAMKEDRPVIVDGKRIRGIRFNEGELEVDWWMPTNETDTLWTVIQPCFLSSASDEMAEGQLTLNTYW